MLSETAVKVRGAALAKPNHVEVRQAMDRLVLAVITRVFALLYEVERALRYNHTVHLISGFVSHTSAASRQHSYEQDLGVFASQQRTHKIGVFASQKHTHKVGVFASQQRTHKIGVFASQQHTHKVGVFASQKHTHKSRGICLTKTYSQDRGICLTTTYSQDRGICFYNKILTR